MYRRSSIWNRPVLPSLDFVAPIQRQIMPPPILPSPPLEHKPVQKKVYVTPTSYEGIPSAGGGDTYASSVLQCMASLSALMDTLSACRNISPFMKSLHTILKTIRTKTERDVRLAAFEDFLGKVNDIGLKDFGAFRKEKNIEKDDQRFFLSMLPTINMCPGMARLFQCTQQIAGALDTSSHLEVDWSVDLQTALDTRKRDGHIEHAPGILMVLIESRPEAETRTMNMNRNVVLRKAGALDDGIGYMLAAYTMQKQIGKADFHYVAATHFGAQNPNKRYPYRYFIRDGVFEHESKGSTENPSLAFLTRIQ